MIMENPEPDDWVGRTESRDDTIDASHMEKMAATLGTPVPGVGDVLPLLWHWGLFVTPTPYDGLGADGHAERGGFLPPAEGRIRMWAGGRLEFIRPLLVGTPASRKSTVLAVTPKKGRSGELLFVTVQHEYTQDYVLCLREEQDLVYREPAAPRLQGSEPAPEAEWSQTVNPSSTMLFRYSAVTFNGHRIHYDLDYVQRQEGYPGLVVHGPLIATLMCQAFTMAHPDKVVTSMSYRGQRPLISPAPFYVGGRLVSVEHHDEASGVEDGAGGGAELWAEQDGMLAHQAQLRFKA